MNRLFLFIFVAIFLTVSLQRAVADRKPLQGRGMQFGPCVGHSVTFVRPQDKNAPTWPGAVTRGLVVKLPHDMSLCYDMNLMAPAAIWHGGFLDFGGTHHQSYKGDGPPRPVGEVTYQNLQDPGWLIGDNPDSATLPESIRGQLGRLPLPWAHFKGYYLHGDQVVLSYNVAERDVLEVPGAIAPNIVVRTITVAAGEQPVSVLLAGADDGQVEIKSHRATIRGSDNGSIIALSYSAPLNGMQLRHDGNGRVFAVVPAGEADVTINAYVYAGPETGLDAFSAAVAMAGAGGDDPAELTGGAARRWNEPIVTGGVRAEDSSAYVADELTLPEYPWGSWMRLSAIDAFQDGRLAVSTMSGDVWIVSWQDDDISKLHWQRFATGLYEPLGLKIVDEKIYVRGRDRITRLHDLNHDGEADYYENFHSAGPIGPGYHAFLFDLVTDRDGNFYFAISGRKAPSIGEVIKLSPDGKQRETIATNFRHPNGMGAGGPHDWITIADNPDGKFPSGGMIVRTGRQYGHEGPRTEPFLYLLPPLVDTSSGSQVWTDSKRWGPLSGVLIHTSFSKSIICYIMVQSETTTPNGFAVKMPFAFKSGVMRACVSPADGQVYVAGQRGWDTNAVTDGCIARVRYTGQPAYLVTDSEATSQGIRLKFSCPLDPATVDYDNFYAERAGKAAQEVDIDDVRLLTDHSVLVEIPAVYQPIVEEPRKKDGPPALPRYRVIDPLGITFDIKAKDGTRIKDTVYATVNALPEGSAKAAGGS